MNFIWSSLNLLFLPIFFFSDTSLFSACTLLFGSWTSTLLNCRKICHVMRFCEIVVVDFLQHSWDFIIVHLVFHLEEMSTNLFSICLSNSNSVAGYFVRIVLVHWTNYASTESCLECNMGLHFCFPVFPMIQKLSHNLLQ